MIELHFARLTHGTQICGFCIIERNKCLPIVWPNWILNWTELNVIKIEFSIPFVSLWTHYDWWFSIWPTMRKDNLQCFTKVVVETFYKYTMRLMRNICKFINISYRLYIGEVWKTFENVRRSYIYGIYLYSTNVCIYIYCRDQKSF